MTAVLLNYSVHRLHAHVGNVSASHAVGLPCNGPLSCCQHDHQADEVHTAAGDCVHTGNLYTAQHICVSCRCGAVAQAVTSPAQCCADLQLMLIYTQHSDSMSCAYSSCGVLCRGFTVLDQPTCNFGRLMLVHTAPHISTPSSSGQQYTCTANQVSRSYKLQGHEPIQADKSFYHHGANT